MLKSDLSVLTTYKIMSITKNNATAHKYIKMLLKSLCQSDYLCFSAR